MVRVTTSISIDHKVKEEAKKVLKNRGITLSFFVEQKLRDMIKNMKGGGK